MAIEQRPPYMPGRLILSSTNRRESARDVAFRAGRRPGRKRGTRTNRVREAGPSVTSVTPARSKAPIGRARIQFDRMRIPDVFRTARGARNRYLWLLVWLVAYVLADAIATSAGATMRGVDLIFAGVLLATLRALSRRPAEFWVAAATGAMVLVASVIAAVSPLPAAIAAKPMFGALFAGFLSAAILREVLQGETVDADTIRGAICAYLFAGVAWAGAYGFVENLRPGSLSTPGAGGAAIGRRPDMYIYFSFVT